MMHRRRATRRSGRWIIAEIGNNHEGDFGVAAQILDAAADAGAGAVKLQTFDARRFVRAVRARPPASATRGFQLSAAEVRGAGQAGALAAGCCFFSSPLDLGSVDLLEPLVDAYKVASGDNDFWPLLERIGDRRASRSCCRPGSWTSRASPGARRRWRRPARARWRSCTA